MDSGLTSLAWASNSMGSELAPFRMPSARVVETFDFVEYIGPSVVARPTVLRVGALGFSEENKLSIAELFLTLLARFIEQVMPLSTRRRLNCSLVYCEPWSKRQSRR